MERAFVKIWKIMEILLENYGFSIDDVEVHSDKICEIYYFENDFQDRFVIFNVEYNKRDFDVESIYCTVRDQFEEVLLEEELDQYDMRNLSDYLDYLSKEYEIN